MYKIPVYSKNKLIAKSSNSDAAVFKMPGIFQNI